MFSLAIGGIYSLLILTLTFNFLLAMRLRGVDKKIIELEQHSKEDVAVMENRIRMIIKSIPDTRAKRK